MARRSAPTLGGGLWGVARRGGAAVAATALAVVLVGCGSDADDADSPASSATSAAPTQAATSGSVDPYGGSSATAAPAGTAPAAGAATVTIDNFAFDPETPTFKVGQTVTVVNKDSAPHTWTSDDGGFDTGTLKSGQSTTVTLSKAGTFGVICEIHPSMTGTVTVQP